MMAKFEDKVIVEFLTSFRKRFIENNYYFGSLSETYDNILLWSHYCASHTGFVLAIESNYAL